MCRRPKDTAAGVSSVLIPPVRWLEINYILLFIPFFKAGCAKSSIKISERWMYAWLGAGMERSLKELREENLVNAPQNKKINDSPDSIAWNQQSSYSEHGTEFWLRRSGSRHQDLLNFSTLCPLLDLLFTCPLLDFLSKFPGFQDLLLTFGLPLPLPTFILARHNELLNFPSKLVGLLNFLFTCGLPAHLYNIRLPVKSCWTSRSSADIWTFSEALLDFLSTFDFLFIRPRWNLFSFRVPVHLTTSVLSVKNYCTFRLPIHLHNFGHSVHFSTN